jgi:predicted ABC-type ATPase
MQQPELIIIGGANGVGKTTLAREFVAVEKLRYLGADDIAHELNADHPERAAIAAARLFSARLNAALEAGESLVVEITLSGLHARKWLEKAVERGYRVVILFVYLDSAELCLERIAARVAMGGHAVPEPDVRRRFVRSTANFWQAYRNLADEWALYYNAGATIVQVAGGDQHGMIVLDETRYEQWIKMVTR